MDFLNKGCYIKKLNNGGFMAIPNEAGRKGVASGSRRATENVSEVGITKETVEYMAHLARIELKPEELEKLSGQLQDIINFIDKLKKLDVNNISPTSHILPLENVFREDTARESLPVDKVLMNAPCRQGNFFSVPKVIE